MLHLIIPILFSASMEVELPRPEEMECLSKTIYFESRGEGIEGQIAVAKVVANRVTNDPRRPDTICEVVKEWKVKRLHRCEFSWYCDGKSDTPKDLLAWRNAQFIAWLSIFIDDITEGATYYHADYVRWRWRKDFQRTVKIGKHIFYKEKDEEVNTEN